MTKDCLYCKRPTVVQRREEFSEKFKVMYMFCQSCKRDWKDYEGVDHAASPILSVQRSSSEPINKSPESKG